MNHSRRQETYTAIATHPISKHLMLAKRLNGATQGNLEIFANATVSVIRTFARWTHGSWLLTTAVVFQ